MMLELGVIPVRYVVMQKRMQFLHYILQESKESMLRKVFNALKDDSRKGDFVNLSNQDKKELNINLGVDNKGVGLCNEAVPVQVRPFEVGGSRKTLPR